VYQADIRHAFEMCCYLDRYKNRENVYLLLGFGLNANPVEILYNEFGGKAGKVPVTRIAGCTNCPYGFVNKYYLWQ
jgi:hypothetical protein